MNDPKNKLGQYAGLEQLSTQALEDLLQQDFAAGEDHSNPDLVMAIMEVRDRGDGTENAPSRPGGGCGRRVECLPRREDSAHGT